MLPEDVGRMDPKRWLFNITAVRATKQLAPVPQFDDKKFDTGVVFCITQFLKDKTSLYAIVCVL
jgi:hypothetical protein